jgi:hypothetical protein
MKALVDSGAHAGDAETLRARLSVDGYLFFRGLLPRAQVEAAGAAVHAAGSGSRRERAEASVAPGGARLDAR